MLIFFMMLQYFIWLLCLQSIYIKIVSRACKYHFLLFPAQIIFSHLTLFNYHIYYICDTYVSHFCKF